jgi:anti-sigma factor RsiW
MSDCANIEMREWLPELMHDRLSGADRARLEAHLAACSDCRSELELLESARLALHGLMPSRPDTAAIVRALPRPHRPVVPMVGPARRVWRMAAALTVVTLGGLSFNALRERADRAGMVVGAESTAVMPRDVIASVDTPVQAPERTGVTAGLGTTDLADDDLEALIGALEQLEAAPHLDPDANRLGRLVGSTGGD